MMNRHDPLSVLVSLKNEFGLELNEEVIKEIYEIQRENQYNKDRETINQMEKIVEAYIQNNFSGNSLWKFKKL